jgi:predicted nucleic acid-binding protein
MVLIDSSSWIHFLRPNGDKVVRGRVEAILVAGDACWCPVVRLELWNGAGGNQEKKVLRDLERHLPELCIDGGVWNRACELACKARVAGVSVSATDLLIAACAGFHEAQIEHADSDFDLLAAI